MDAYTYERRDAGYVFNVFKPHHQGLVLALFLPAVITAIFTFGIALVVWLVWAVWRLIKNKAGSEITYTNKVATTLTVTPDKIVTQQGKKDREVSTTRLHSIGIKNGYDKGFQVASNRSASGGYIIGGAAGAGMAVADGLSSVTSGISNSVQNQRAKTAFYLTAEVGGKEEKLTTMVLTEVAARGLQTDIIHVLEGKSL